VLDTRLRNPFLSPMDLNRRTHYGFRRTRSERRDSEGRLVESLVDHAQIHFARTTRPQWSTIGGRLCTSEPVSTQALSEVQPWLKWNCLLGSPQRSTVWLRQFQDYRLPLRRLRNNPSCHACCTHRRQNAEAFRRTCYLSALAKGITMQAASSCLRHSIQN
jgi:hypothetical protein